MTYPILPDWGRRRWSLLLVPGWRRVNGRPLDRGPVGRVLLDQVLPADAWRSVRYESLVASRARWS